MDSTLLTRRAVLGALAAAATGCAAAYGDDDDAPTRIPYGAHPSQFAELTLPATPDPAPVVVVLHGGFWSAAYGLELGRPLARDLAARGFAALNVEYRRLGDGGGWPQTGQDVAVAVDTLTQHGGVDLSSVVVLGHSAGGQLAGWLAAQSDREVSLTGAVLQAGVLDLVKAADDGLGGGAVVRYLGVSPEQDPQVYAQASPIALLPFGVPTVCIHGDRDTLVPLDQSERFVMAAVHNGDRSELVTVVGDHFAPITVGTEAWEACVTAITALRTPGGPG